MNSPSPALPPHAISSTALATNLGVDALQGLSGPEAQKRLQHYGLNRLVAEKRSSPLAVFFKQFKNSLIIILLFAAALSGVLGHAVEAVAITVIIIFAAVLGFVQEFRAERALEALRELAAPLALVVRDGREIEIPAQELTLGDVIMLATGDRVPSDARLIETINLKVEEAPLTGESMPVEKDSAIVCSEKAAVGDRRNMVFAGTSVTYGRGRAVVVATGVKTEFGKIAQLLKKVARMDTPLQKDLQRLGGGLTKMALIIVVVIILLGVFHGQPLLEMVIFGIALAVAVVPEALPAVVTITLALGVQRMAKRHALIRHLPAVEALGSTTIICSDKTGTLTKDEMTVRKIFLDGGVVLDVTGSGYEPVGEFLHAGTPYPVTNTLRLLLQAGALASDARLAQIDGTWDLHGDPTEAALVVAAHKAGLKKELLDEKFQRIAEIPFSSETKRMTTLHKSGNETVAYTKGAAEIILSSCTRYQTEGGVRPLTAEARQAILSATQTFADGALRVMGVAYLETINISAAEKDLIFLGLFGMIDPPRAEAKLAIASCRKAGIKVMMITGDHPATAKAVATELALLPLDGKILTGLELETMSMPELERIIENVAICARVSPEHKLKIVEALQRRGHIVAMTGDGVNDAPALKAANIGIAMGIAGTDVTKEAAAMILTDDNFASIVAAIEEGRVIFSNIKKFLTYLLSSNFGEIGLIVLASLLVLPLPLSAVQILYINLASDGLPALALAVDPPEKGIMEHSPRKFSDGFFSRSVLVLMTVGGLWAALITVSLFIWANQSGRELAHAVTMVFSSLVLLEFLKTYNFRSDHRSVFHHPFNNRWLNRAVAWELVLLGSIIYIPFLQRAFATVALSITDWVIVAICATTIVPVLELTKWLTRKLKKQSRGLGIASGKIAS